jgi:hypothetical protein
MTPTAIGRSSPLPYTLVDLAVDGIGHDLPEPAWRPAVDALADNIAADTRSRETGKEL